MNEIRKHDRPSADPDTRDLPERFPGMGVEQARVIVSTVRRLGEAHFTHDGKMYRAFPSKLGGSEIWALEDAGGGPPGPRRVTSYQDDDVPTVYAVQLAQPLQIMVGVARDGRVLLGSPTLDREHPVHWQSQLSGPEGLAELQQVLEQARVDSERVTRQLHPSDLDEAILRELASHQAEGGKGMTVYELHRKIPVHGTQEIRNHLRALEADGKIRPGNATTGGLFCWVTC